MSNNPAAVEEAQAGAPAEVTLTLMPEDFQAWGTYHFDPRDLIIDHTANIRRFGVDPVKVAAMREDFLNPNMGQLQECGVYWDAIQGAFKVMFGFHRAEAALGITKDGAGPDEGGVFLLRCVVHPAGDLVAAMGVSLAENSPRTKSDMTPMDKAFTIARMLENGYQQKDIAARLGYSKALISQLKHFVDFPLATQKAIAAGKITQAAAFELIPLAENLEALAEKTKELMANSGTGGKVNVSSVREAARAANGEGDGGEGDGGNTNEAGDVGDAAPAKAPRTARSMKDVMAFLRDYSDAEKGAELSPAQVALGIVLKFAEGKLKEKAAQKQLDTKLSVVK